MKTVLTIAGSDSSGGAGIQADLKTFAAHGLYGMSVITAITAQNTTGVYAIQEISPDMIKCQLDAIFTDIFPDAVKIGMVCSLEIIQTIADRLAYYNAKNVVLDTVMLSTSGHELLKPAARETMITKLFPLTDMITPNIPEAEILSGISIKTKADMIKAAQLIGNYYSGYILIKGGHLNKSADDLLYDQTSLDPVHWIAGIKVSTNNSHGTGCTLSSAIASNLGKEYNIIKAITMAKFYLNGALRDGLNLGKGNGPLNHIFSLGGDYFEKTIDS